MEDGVEGYYDDDENSEFSTLNEQEDLPPSYSDVVTDSDFEQINHQNRTKAWLKKRKCHLIVIGFVTMSVVVIGAVCFMIFVAYRHNSLTDDQDGK